MVRMQKMPMPKVPARGSITDKKKMPMPYKGGKPSIMPRGPKSNPVGGVLEKAKERLLPRRGPGGLGPKKQAPNGRLNKAGEKLKKAYGNSLNNMQMQKAGPSDKQPAKRSLGNSKLQSMFQGGPAVSRKDTQKGGRGKLPNFKGPFQGLAKPKPRKPLVPRRGR